MEKLTYAEIAEIICSEILEEFEHAPRHWMRDDVCRDVKCVDKYYSEGVDSTQFKEQFVKLGKFKIVEEHGGEGMGDEYYKIWHFIDHDIYISFDGWYSSHEGTEYNDMCEVFPELETRTVYKAKK